MNLLGLVTGNASEVSVKKLAQEFSSFLVDGEEVLAGFAVIRDTIVFTNKRLVLVDVQGTSGKKREYITIPYKNILRFSKESKGTFDLDSELKIWVRGSSTPISKSFRKNDNVDKIYKILSQATLD